MRVSMALIISSAEKAYKLYHELLQSHWFRETSTATTTGTQCKRLQLLQKKKWFKS
jgi:hypothetical protein